MALNGRFIIQCPVFVCVGKTKLSVYIDKYESVLQLVMKTGEWTLQPTKLNSSNLGNSNETIKRWPQPMHASWSHIDDCVASLYQTNSRETSANSGCQNYLTEVKLEEIGLSCQNYLYSPNPNPNPSIPTLRSPHEIGENCPRLVICLFHSYFRPYCPQ